MDIATDNEVLKRRIRLATDKDKLQIFNWRNSDFLVKLSAAQKKVTWLEHSAWFNSVLQSESIQLNILEVDGQSVGQIRFEKIAQSRYVVSIYLIESHVEKGLGAWFLNEGINNICISDGQAEFEAIIQAENFRSISLFRKLGFFYDKNQGVTIDGVESIRMVKLREKNEFDLIALKKFYAENVCIHLNGVKSLAWGSEESQIKRFEVLSKLGDVTGCKVLDVGCGLGDFGHWLRNNGYRCEYVGYDISKEMIAQAKIKYPTFNFFITDILNDEVSDGQYDYVFSSGIFNRKINNHEKFVEKMIHRMYEISKKGLAFNILSDNADFKEPDEYCANPDELSAFCRKISKNVAIDHGYMKHDFTIFMRK